MQRDSQVHWFYEELLGVEELQGVEGVRQVLKV